MPNTGSKPLLGNKLRHLPYIPLLLLNAGASVLVPPILADHLELPKKLHTTVEIGLGGLIFIALSIVELLFYAKSLFERDERAVEIARIHDALDAHIHNVKKSFRSINLGEGTPNIAYNYFLRKLLALDHDLNSVAAVEELKVDQEHLYLSDIVLGIFDARPGEVVAVHRLKHADQLLGVHELQWLQKVHGRLKEGRISGIRRLLLYQDDAQLATEITQDIISAHINTAGYDYRLLREATFDRLLVEYGAEKGIVDFAVYAGSVVFKALSYGPQSIEAGYYTENKRQVNQYGQLFEDCWRNGKLLSRRPRRIITIDSLIASGG